MRHFLSLLALTFCAIWSWAATVTPPEKIPAYYTNVDGTSEGGLWDALKTASKKGYSTLTYKGIWTAFASTDVYPSDSIDKAGKIWDMYGTCDFVYSDDQCGGYSKECDCYNREHSIPKNWFGAKDEKTNSPGTDLFHIVATDGSVNNTRSSYAFGEVPSPTYSYGGSKFGNGGEVSVENTILGTGSVSKTPGSSVRVFEPKDEYKGDFARMYMGTMIRWANEFAFTSGDGKKIFSGTYTAAYLWGLTEYGVVLLMKWHREDPVSQKEIDRNNGVQKTQGNRNPFIDYPYLAEYFWGEKAGQTVNLNQLMPSTDPDFVQGKSNGWRGEEQAINTPESHIDARKVLIDGLLYIVVEDHIFNLQGQRIK